MAKRKELFHYSATGFGHHTACFIPIPKWGAPRKKSDPSWGGSITEGVNCPQCLLNVLVGAKLDIERATRNLAKLLKVKK